MNSRQTALLALVLVFVFSLCFAQDKNGAGVRPMPNLDLTNFSGKWYEIARLPTPFEEGLSRITATYNLSVNGEIEVINEGIKDGKPTSVKGRAWAPDPKVPAKMLISFFLWFASDYIILDMDAAGKSYLVVKGRTMNSYWLFSRTPKMDKKLFDRKLEEAGALGFDLSKLILVDQD